MPWPWFLNSGFRARRFGSGLRTLPGDWAMTAAFGPEGCLSVVLFLHVLFPDAFRARHHPLVKPVVPLLAPADQQHRRSRLVERIEDAQRIRRATRPKLPDRVPRSLHGRAVRMPELESGPLQKTDETVDQT